MTSFFVNRKGLAAVFLLAGALAPAQSQLDPSQALRQQAASQGFGISDIGGIPPRTVQGVPGTSINSVHSDAVPYVADNALDDSLYIVGPGDVFQLHFEGTSLEKQVTPEGSVLLNRIGTVRLEGLTLREAKTRLLDKLAMSYKRSDCYVALSRPKVMRVFVTGAVQHPGPYEIPGNYRLTDALRVAGWYTSMAQRGDVKIVFGDSTSMVSPERFLMQGDLSANPYLRQGAVVQVPVVDYSKPWVTVRRDGEEVTIQTDSTESLSDVMFKTYSFTTPPPYSSLLVKEKDGRDTVVEVTEAPDYKPRAGAFIEVISNRQNIFVAGAVARPGLQPFIADHKVIQYISMAGLLTSSKVPRKIEVIRVDGERRSLPLQSADLQPGDVLIVKQNAEQKFLIYTPILLSFVSLSLAVITVFGINN